ncbi:Alpha/beta hydrolase fold-1 domain-containing protein [Penicillium ucsense]|uniref:Alpha/beta hydrolase fold-1 domain-containing protein n=1 Tax=Penicillium ucsense TaxID=2839758 RepID=A0A8J8W1D7_9EURO|nr:Alpha/beta hydrolase fold-1 domain-containing protein [Penicillium ucsense]KAF7734228.1 Alpha/beta hydrolase fold-1 domain-containing protein [Penicillium ucsense]
MFCGRRLSLVVRRPCHQTVSYASDVGGRENQRMQLPDGRTLGFAEHGRSDDYPLIFMHGFPSSRLETLGIDEIALRQRIRVITPDRNGFGLTTFDPKRTILQWPHDIQALGQHLGLSRFAILGGSGGGPFALACAYRLPPDMLSAVGIMAGAGPWEAGTYYMTSLYRACAKMAHRWPSSYAALLQSLVWTLKKVLFSPFGARQIDKLLAKTEAAQGSEETAAVLRENLSRQLLEAFRQGPKPALHETRLLTSYWGINFEDVTYDEIKIWHGTNDINAPIQMIRYMAERLPHCHLNELPGDTHFTLQRHLESILAELVHGSPPANKYE